MSENHLGPLLDQAQAEVHSVKQKLDHNLKQEKQRLHQKLVTKRRREMLQKVIMYSVTVYPGIMLKKALIELKDKA